MRDGITYVSFYTKSNTIRIYKRTIRAMGMPNFIRLRIHQTKRLIIIEPYHKMTFASFRVPSPSGRTWAGFDIHSKRFTEIVATMMNWDTERTYRVRGKFYEGQKIIRLDLLRAEHIF